ncbi:MAG: hypothetical protein ACLFPJ_06390 [Candidatus Woesearchaeota archaeon]
MAEISEVMLIKRNNEYILSKFFYDGWTDREVGIKEISRYTDEDFALFNLNYYAEKFNVPATKNY